MRAIVLDEFGPPEQLRVREMPMPRPGPGEVLVEVHAAPVNYVDLLVVGGTYQSLPARPFIPGKGPAGVVTALGSDVTAPRVGERVLAMAEEGGYAEGWFSPPTSATACRRACPFSRQRRSAWSMTRLGSPCASAHGWLPARPSWCSVPRVASAVRIRAHVRGTAKSGDPVHRYG